MNIYYAVETGKIIGFDSSLVAQDIPGADFIVVANDTAVDVTTDMVDPATLEFRKSTSNERYNFNLPTVIDIVCRRPQEMIMSDWRESQPAWAAYRQALRDITKAGSPVAMIEAWPLRPDGSDAIPDFRKRIDPLPDTQG